MKGRTPSRPSRTTARSVIYRSRDFVPIPLAVARASWRERSIIGESYEPPRGGWDVVLAKSEGTVTREIHWPKPRLVLKADGRLLTISELEVILDVIRGRHTVGRMQVTEKLTPADPQTAWDLEVSSEKGSGLPHLTWNSAKKTILAGLQAERDHRLHMMMEDAMESSWWKTGGGSRSQNHMRICTRLDGETHLAEETLSCCATTEHK